MGWWIKPGLALAMTVMALAAATHLSARPAPAAVHAGARGTSTGPPARVPPGTFVSLVPACACAAHTTLQEFSERTGRMLKTLATIPEPAQGTEMSTIASDDEGRIDYSLARGPRCGVKGVFLEGCPQNVPDSCTNAVEQLKPGDVAPSTLFTLPGSVSVAGSEVVPNPAGTEVLIHLEPCTSRTGMRGLVIRDLATGRQTTLAETVNACDGYGDPAWNPAGTQIAFPYSRARGGPTYGAVMSCPEAASDGVAVVSLRTGEHPGPVKVVARPDRGCRIAGAAFDRTGLVAAEGCPNGSPTGARDSYIGNAYLLQFDAHARRIRRIALKVGLEHAEISETRSGSVLVTQDQPANNGTPEDDWVWAFDSTQLRPIAHYKANDAAQVLAVAW